MITLPHWIKSVVILNWWRRCIVEAGRPFPYLGFPVERSVRPNQRFGYVLQSRVQCQVRPGIWTFYKMSETHNPWPLHPTQTPLLILLVLSRNIQSTDPVAELQTVVPGQARPDCYFLNALSIFCQYELLSCWAGCRSPGLTGLLLHRSCPPVDHHQCHVSSPVQTDYSNNLKYPNNGNIVRSSVK